MNNTAATNAPSIATIRQELALARQAVSLGMLSEMRNVEALTAELARAEAA